MLGKTSKSTVGDWELIQIWDVARQQRENWTVSADSALQLPDALVKLRKGKQNQIMKWNALETTKWWWQLGGLAPLMLSLRRGSKGQDAPGPHWARARPPQAAGSRQAVGGDLCRGAKSTRRSPPLCPCTTTTRPPKVTSFTWSFVHWGFLKCKHSWWYLDPKFSDEWVSSPFLKQVLTGGREQLERIHSMCGQERHQLIPKGRLEAEVNPIYLQLYKGQGKGWGGRIALSTYSLLTNTLQLAQGKDYILTQHQYISCGSAGSSGSQRENNCFYPRGALGSSLGLSRKHRQGRQWAPTSQQQFFPPGVPFSHQVNSTSICQASTVSRTLHEGRSMKWRLLQGAGVCLCSS